MAQSISSVTVVHPLQLPKTNVWDYALSSKESIVDIQSYISMITTLDGRDKVTKLIQYIARFVGWYYTSQRWNTFKTQLSISRKAFRFGRTIIELHKLYTMNIITKLVSVTTTNRNNEPLWKTIGTIIKTVGLAGFWGADNITYLAMCGMFDTDTDDKIVKQHKQQQLQIQSTIISNRCYFVGALAGLYVNLRSYIQYVYQTLRPIERRIIILQQQQQQQQQQKQQQSSLNVVDNNNDDSIIYDTTTTETTDVELYDQYKKYKEQQFVLLVATIKSICDVLVFSNNPGIDLWSKYTPSKSKLHEGIHCCCGIISACTVLYNNFPNKKTITTTSSLQSNTK